MKKVIAIATIGLFFSCKQVTSEDWDADSANLGRRDLMINGMHYVIISQSDRGTYVINLTKDSLEVERLKSTR